MNSRSIRFTLTGSRTCGKWPLPSIVTSAPPVASASASPRRSGLIASWSPWFTSTGHRTRAHALANRTGAPLVVVEGADHMIPGRHPVLANLLIRDFVNSLEGADR